MLTSERKAHILKLLRQDRRVIAKDVSRSLHLSEDTIRRDLRELAGEGLLQRVHGGALPVAQAAQSLAKRREVSAVGKAAIGRAAAALVRAGQVIALDGGTTAAQLARHLAPDLKATVITHSPSIAVELGEHPSLEVELIGGRLFKHSMVAVGSVAADAIARIRPDIYFMGVTGVHVDAGLTTGDAEEAAIKRALSRQAAETVVLASREKLGVASPYLVARFDEVDTLLVEPGLDQKLLRPYRKSGLSVVIA
jgi:DeoR/GlpR family transcriptional regulator of sugar metabolism